MSYDFQKFEPIYCLSRIMNVGSSFLELYMMRQKLHRLCFSVNSNALTANLQQSSCRIIPFCLWIDLHYLL